MPFHDVPRVPPLCLSGNMWLGWPNAAWFGECQGTPKRAHSSTLLLAPLSPSFLGVGTRTFFLFNWKQKIVTTQFSIRCGRKNRATVKILIIIQSLLLQEIHKSNFKNRHCSRQTASSRSSQHYTYVSVKTTFQKRYVVELTEQSCTVSKYVRRAATENVVIFTEDGKNLCLNWLKIYKQQWPVIKRGFSSVFLFTLNVTYLQMLTVCTEIVFLANLEQRFPREWETNVWTKAYLMVFSTI